MATNEFGLCETCGTPLNNTVECCELCGELEAKNIRSVAQQVLINSIPCGVIMFLYDASRKETLYYGMLDKFPGFKTACYLHPSEVLNELYAVNAGTIEEIPPEPTE